MNPTILKIAGTAAALLVTGCASMPNDNVQANAANRECKAITVYSASETIRNDVRGTAQPDEIARTEGQMDMGRAKLHAPLQGRALPETNVLNAAARDC